MSDTFSAAATLNQSAQISASVFSAMLKINDKSGNYSGFDLQAGDFIFVDITNNRINNSDVARYKINTVTSRDAFSASVVIEFIDTGDSPDPNDYLNQPAFVCRKLSGKFAWIASETLQDLPEYLTTYARNLDASYRLLVSGVEYRTLTQQEITAKKIKLTALPISDIALNIYKGAPAWLNEDFTVENDELKWGGLGLDGLVAAGDRFIVSYNKYNTNYQ
jgi:hypothetical protein